jgi:hypothetical protein
MSASEYGPSQYMFSHCSRNDLSGEEAPPNVPTSSAMPLRTRRRRERIRRNKAAGGESTSSSPAAISRARWIGSVELAAKAHTIIGPTMTSAITRGTADPNVICAASATARRS